MGFACIDPNCFVVAVVLLIMGHNCIGSTDDPFGRHVDSKFYEWRNLL